MTINAAGGVVLNAKGEVLVVSQRGDSWSLPKGHVDPGEEMLEAARREIKEESGISDLVLVKELGTYERYKIGKGGTGEDTSELKRITIYLFATTEETLKPEDPHNPEAKWVKKEEAAALLTHPKDREFFKSVMGQF